MDRGLGSPCFLGEGLGDASVGVVGGIGTDLGLVGVKITSRAPNPLGSGLGLRVLPGRWYRLGELFLGDASIPGLGDIAF